MIPTRRLARPIAQPRRRRCGRWAAWLAAWVWCGLPAALGALVVSAPQPAAAQAGVPATAASAPQEPGAATPTAGADEPEVEGEVLETTRRAVRSTFEWLARGVDSWFGDRPFEEGGSVTDGRMTLSVLERHGDRTDWNLRFNARFRLPNVERQTYLFVGRDNEREVVTDQPAATTQRERLRAESSADQSFFVGLGVWLREHVDVRLGLRGAFRPYAQLRYSRPWQLTPADLVEFRQTLFWTVTDQVGSTTALSYERALSETQALRWLNLATITRRTERFEWSSVFGHYTLLGKERVLALEALAAGRQGVGVDVDDYGLRVRWEQPTHRDWLLVELIGGRFWPRADAASPRIGTWAVGVGLKMKF